MELASRRRRQTTNIWPGFVDALASVIMVIIFVLMIFVAAYVSLSEALSGRDAALEKLTRDITELTALLSSVRDQNALLVQQGQELSRSLATTEAARTALEGTLSETRAQLSETETELAQTSATLAARSESLEEREAELSAALAASSALQESLEALASLRVDLAAQLEEALAELQNLIKERETLNLALEERTQERDSVADELESVVAELQSVLAIQGSLEAELQSVSARGEQEITALQSTIAGLEATNAEQAQRIASLEGEVAERQALLDQETEANRALGAERDAEKAALEGRIATLTEQTEADARRLEARETLIVQLRAGVENLRAEIQTLNAALEASEAETRAQKAEILDLGRKLNRALVSKVEELARYRSEFFGRLRTVLGDRPDIRVVGDRFVFQSELLFNSGSARIGTAGREQLAQFGQTLLDLSDEIPADVDWILRVDGHTDVIPINTEIFPSNWELSTARALSVVKFLAAQGIPSERLSAAGFGEFHPLDPEQSETAYRRNRRIELRLTKR